MRQSALNERFTLTTVPIAETYLAREKLRVGDVDAPSNQLESS